jgi:hypothetical protein
MLVIPYLVVAMLLPKSDLSPTKLELLKAMKISDILDLSFPGKKHDFCYIFEHLTSPKFL